MRLVFADTGYWQAILNPNDQLHERATEASKGLGKARIVTTEMVLAELLAALSRRATRSVVTHGVVAIRRDPNVDVVPQTALQFDAAFRFYGHHQDKDWSLTDCASFVLMRERAITDALAHDKHFAQAGFKILLGD